MKIPFVGPTYQSVSPKWDPERAVNVYVESNGPATESEPSALVSRPGLRLKVAVGSGPIRGLHAPRASGASGNLIVVSGNTLYRVDSALAVTSVGTVGGGTTPVSISDNGTDAIIVDGSANGWTLALATNTLAAISQGGFYGGMRVDFLDGYFILNKPGTQIFYISDLYSTTFNALNFASAESIPDALQTLAVANRELWLFGTNSFEIYQTRESGFTFQRLQGAAELVGCAAPRSVSVHETNLFWLGASVNSPLGVYRNNGYQALRISPPAIERVINKRANLSDVVGYTYSEDSHIFYVMNFLGTNDTALVYDLSSQVWHERGHSPELIVIATPTVAVVAPLAIFAGGFTTTTVGISDKYTYSTNAVAVGASLSAARRNLAAASDAIVGIFGGGYSGATVNSVATDRYTYITDVFVSGNSLSPAKSNHAATGGPDYALFGAGYTTTDTSTTQKYAYTSDILTSGTALLTPRRALAAAGNATLGLFAGGYDGAISLAVTDKYTYATSVVTIGTVLGTARNSLAASASQAVAIFGGGITSASLAVTDRYTFIDNTVAAGVSLGTARWSLACASDGTTAVFAGGNSAVSQVGITDRYTHQTNIMVPGGTLTATRADMAGASSS